MRSCVEKKSRNILPVCRHVEQVDALKAAVSNSLDHWEPLQRSYSTLKEKLEEQALRHGDMLEVRRALYFICRGSRRDVSHFLF